MHRFKIFFYTNQKIILSSIVFLSVFFVLGVPFSDWGFSYDDFGMIWHSKVSSWQDLLRFFYEGSDSLAFRPSNYVAPEQSFFAVYYRPLAFILRCVQRLFFGFCSYYYFLVIIFLHAMNSVLLFYVFQWFFALPWAFWGATFFAFYPSLCGWLGWITAFHQMVSFTFIILTIICFKKYIDTKHCLFYLASSLLFLMALFTRETAIVLPFWFIMALFFYDKRMQSFSFFKRVWHYITITSVFWLTSLFYLVLRLILFPIKFAGHGFGLELNLAAFLLQIKTRFFEAVTFASDLAGLSFMDGGQRFLKGCLIIVFFGTLFFLFVKNKKKTTIMFCVFSMFLFMWQAVLRYYASRYLYPVLPFYIAMLILLITCYKSIHNVTLKKISLAVLPVVVFLNSVFLYSALKQRECFLHKVDLAFNELCENKMIHDRVLCFVGLPWSSLRTGIAQAVWLRGININLPIYYDRGTWGCSDAEIFNNYVTITKNADGFRIKTTNPEKMWIAGGGQAYSMGKKIVHQRVNGRISDMSFYLDKKYLEQNLVFITWDYEEMRFKFLD